jgi:7,8-dihydropterin-6-yl-methyl-4-(beta-D-ribofuranosyl)aminobenzene 5'-phosphate synthase
MSPVIRAVVKSREDTMSKNVGRREFLRNASALAGAAAASGFMCVELAEAAPTQVPVVDKLSVQVLVDLSHNIFLRPTMFNGMSVTPAPRASD